LVCFNLTGGIVLGAPAPAPQSASPVSRVGFAGLLLCCPSAAIAAVFPMSPPGYREFAYVSNGSSNTVSVLDLVYLRQDRTLQVGIQPTGLAVNPKRNEVYVVNTGRHPATGLRLVIDTEANRVVATIPVHKLPYFIDVDAAGHRAYVANSGSNTVSVIDLDSRREIGVVGTGEQPGLARISPDMRTLVVTNRGSGSVSIFAVNALPQRKPSRSFPACRSKPKPAVAGAVAASARGLLRMPGRNRRGHPALLVPRPSSPARVATR
jgi:YVTN family beta-propeller protein